MKGRRYILPRVIEMNYQAGHRLGVNVYLVDGGRDYILIDIGYEDTLGEIVDLIRGMDYSLSNCRMISPPTPMPTTSRPWPAPGRCSRPPSPPTPIA